MINQVNDRNNTELQNVCLINVCLLNVTYAELLKTLSDNIKNSLFYNNKNILGLS